MHTFRVNDKTILIGEVKGTGEWRLCVTDGALKANEKPAILARFENEDAAKEFARIMLSAQFDMMLGWYTREGAPREVALSGIRGNVALGQVMSWPNNGTPISEAHAEWQDMVKPEKTRSEWLDESESESEAQ